MTLVTSKLDGIVIFDRKVDMLTPFITQFSIQGQIDELFGLEFNQVLIPKHMVETEANPDSKDSSETKSVNLCKEDEVFEELKDFTLDHARVLLVERLNEFKQELGKEMDLQKLKEFYLKYHKKGKPDQFQDSSKIMDSAIVRMKLLLSIVLHLHENLQKPINYKMMELEQVRSYTSSKL